MAPMEEPQDEALLSLEGIDYVQNKDGRNEWRLIAQDASYTKSQDITEFRQVHFIYYLPDGREIHLTGEAGEMNLQDRSVEVHGDVKVEVPGRLTLETDEITYRDDSKEFRSPGEIRLRTRLHRIRGNGLWASVAERKLVIENNVTTELYVSDLE